VPGVHPLKTELGIVARDQRKRGKNRGGICTGRPVGGVDPRRRKRDRREEVVMGEKARNLKGLPYIGQRQGE